MAAALQMSPAPLWDLHRPQILQENSTPSSIGSLHGLQRHCLHRLQGNLCSGTCRAVSCSHLGGHRTASRAFSFTPHCRAEFYPSSRTCKAERLSSALRWVCQNQPCPVRGGQPWPLLTEATPAAPINTS